MKQRTYHRFARLITWVLLAPSLIVSMGTIATAQQPERSADELFTKARELAFSGKRPEARELLHLALFRSPGYADIRVFLARAHAWDGNYDSARIALRHVLAEDPAHREAISALIDVELWSDSYGNALSGAEGALIRFPADPEFTLKKARALKNLGRTQEAVAVLRSGESRTGPSPELSAFRERLEAELLTYTVSLNYSLDLFSDVYDPMHLRYIQVGTQTPYGSLLLRASSGFRFGEGGFQGEVDFYPAIAQGVYGYVNYGYSGAPIFPRHRAGAELYYSLPASLEASAGFRYLSFRGGGHVTMYTASVGWYVGNYYLSLRPYFTPDGETVSKSASLQVRRYIGDADTYVSAKAGAGFSPDEKRVIFTSGGTASEIYVLKSQVVGAGAQVALSRLLWVNASVDVTRQELSFGEYVLDYSMSLGLKMAF